MWVTRVRELSDGEEMVWTEPTPPERELFGSDPRQTALDARASALHVRRAARRVREE